MLGEYRVIRPIARGAISTVYLAFDRFGAPYAIKVFPRGLEARAEREWVVGSRLRHPHINPALLRLSVPSEQEGEAERPAVLLAFAPGERLSEHEDKSLGIFKQLLEALAHMHQQGFVHRDVKPDNLVVDGVGNMRLVDFDLSGLIGERFSKRIRVGTIGYLAPEQIMGETPYPAADVYSAGVILYWMLLGELPFSGSPSEVLEAHLKHPPPRLHEIEGPMRGFLGRMLAKHPKTRLRNGQEALEAFLELDDSKL